MVELHGAESGAVVQRDLRTVVFTDICSSTQTAAAMGDRRWRALLSRHHVLVRSRIAATGGIEVSDTGDGFMALYDSPDAALELALGLVADVRDLGLEIRVGLHTGACDIAGSDVSGIAVHVAARVMALAEPSEILVSSTVRDLAAGSDVSFHSRGSHQLKGLPRTWRLFAAERLGAQPPPAPRRAAGPRRPAAARPGVAKRSSAQRALTVVLADDHPLWRQTLRLVLERGRFAKVVAEGSTGAEALALVRQHRPDVVVMDLDMPEVDGITATRALLGDSDQTRVLVLSSSDEPEKITRAVRAGASGYLLKTADSADIRSALTRVAAGEAVFPPDIAAIVLGELRSEPPEETFAEALTEREVDIVRLMADGLSNAAIAEQLHISLKTVEAHSGALFAKLGVDGSPSGNRRVLAVVTWMRQQAAAGVSPYPKL